MHSRPRYSILLVSMVSRNTGRKLRPVGKIGKQRRALLCEIMMKERRRRSGLHYRSSNGWGGTRGSHSEAGGKERTVDGFFDLFTRGIGGVCAILPCLPPLQCLPCLLWLLHIAAMCVNRRRLLLLTLLMHDFFIAHEILCLTRGMAALQSISPSL